MHFVKKSAMWFVLVLSVLVLGVSTLAQVGKAKFGVPVRLVLNGLGGFHSRSSAGKLDFFSVY